MAARQNQPTSATLRLNPGMPPSGRSCSLQRAVFDAIGARFSRRRKTLIHRVARRWCGACPLQMMLGNGNRFSAEVRTTPQACSPGILTRSGLMDAIRRSDLGDASRYSNGAIFNPASSPTYGPGCTLSALRAPRCQEVVLSPGFRSLAAHSSPSSGSASFGAACAFRRAASASPR